MNIQLFPHHPKCNPNYPEKPKGEKAGLIQKTDMGDGEILYQCVDCGAHILTKEKKSIDNMQKNRIVDKVRQLIKERSNDRTK